MKKLILKNFYVLLVCIICFSGCGKKEELKINHSANTESINSEQNIEYYTDTSKEIVEDIFSEIKNGYKTYDDTTIKETLKCNDDTTIKGYKILTSEKTYIDINFDTLEILVPKDRITNTSDKLDIIVLANFEALPSNKYYYEENGYSIEIKFSYQNKERTLTTIDFVDLMMALHPNYYWNAKADGFYADNFMRNQFEEYVLQAINTSNYSKIEESFTDSSNGIKSKEKIIELMKKGYKIEYDNNFLNALKYDEDKILFEGSPKLIIYGNTMEIDIEKIKIQLKEFIQTGDYGGQTGYAKIDNLELIPYRYLNIETRKYDLFNTEFHSVDLYGTLDDFYTYTEEDLNNDGIKEKVGYIGALKEHQTKKYKYDLNNDGIDEEIILYGENNAISINGVKKEWVIHSISKVWIVDLNLHDNYKEIILYTNGPSDDPEYCILRWQNEEIHQISLPGSLYIDRNGIAVGEYWRDILNGNFFNPRLIKEYAKINNDGITIENVNLENINLSGRKFEILNPICGFFENPENKNSIEEYNVLGLYEDGMVYGIYFSDLKAGTKFEILKISSEEILVKLEDGRVGWLTGTKYLPVD